MNLPMWKLTLPSSDMTSPLVLLSNLMILSVTVNGREGTKRSTLRTLSGEFLVML